MKTRWLPPLLLYLFHPMVFGLTTGDLTFVDGDDPSAYSPMGTPNSTYNISNEISEDIVTKFYAKMPEGSPVDVSFIDPSKSLSIPIDADLNGASHATARVTFLTEGACFINSIGYVVFDTNNPPNSLNDINEHVIIFPNISKIPTGELVFGDTVDLNIELQPGQTIAFFLIPNGFGFFGSYNNIASMGFWGVPFYTHPNLNPEPTTELKPHNVAFIDPQHEMIVMGFEAIYRPQSDNDFNDIIFGVQISPFSAIDGVDATGTVDTKFEPLDEVISDVEITTVYPAANTYSTIAYEDNWPLLGDYDFNDVVWRYQITEVLNEPRDVKRFTAAYTLQSMGASYFNGFALHLPNVHISEIASATVTKNGVAVGYDVIQSASSEVVLIIAEDLITDLDEEGLLTETCHHYRTQVECLDQQPANVLTYDLSVEFNTPISRNLIGYAPFDPFIFAKPHTHHGPFTETPPGKSWQTHLKAFPGTSIMNGTFFNTYDDNSYGLEWFLTDNNMPWVINIRDNWDHPIEYIDISLAYPNFPAWVTSSGATNTNWYQSPDSSKTIQANP
ncbi:hypothetical protein BS333_04485 [Vibrio azureus]|uniref:LruC domain-containing protein n=1 Tax=Vibrio azureus NBRC 104587 TaxID=1219077 RepID=U3AC06_9VIBR|nr:LruC domain-containing protein [Vibrio azureus]AUI85687.1 hypothetical protein BS333_04485 [Vibrio azureus]GAD77461.1 hypothetical protein VAZ01S_076_00290 [Vibrio azureus NBRC 104587]